MPATKAKQMSFLDAAAEVLRDADGPMHIKALTDEIIARKLVHTEGKTPQATLAALILGGVKRGTFVKTDKATFDLAELNPKGNKKRPSA